MTEPLSDARLAQIRSCSAPPFADVPTQIVYGTLQELLGEVDRLKTHLEASFGASEALCENAGALDAECRRLRDTAAEILAAAAESGVVPAKTLDRWREAIWPLPTGWSMPEVPRIQPGSLWDCPDSPSWGQRAHNFGDLGQPPAECLNGCGMTWERLQEEERS